MSVTITGIVPSSGLKPKSGSDFYGEITSISAGGGNKPIVDITGSGVVCVIDSNFSQNRIRVTIDGQVITQGNPILGVSGLKLIATRGHVIFEKNIKVEMLDDGTTETSRSCRVSGILYE